jgi:hypothetical protein
MNDVTAPIRPLGAKSDGMPEKLARLSQASCQMAKVSAKSMSDFAHRENSIKSAT